jgi:hypothetical protein
MVRAPDSSCAFPEQRQLDGGAAFEQHPMRDRVQAGAAAARARRLSDSCAFPRAQRGDDVPQLREAGSLALRSAIDSTPLSSAGKLSLLSLQVFHVRVELMEALIPRAAIVAEPLGGARERRWVEAHRAELGVAAARDKPGTPEHLA